MSGEPTGGADSPQSRQDQLGSTNGEKAMLDTPNVQNDGKTKRRLNGRLFLPGNKAAVGHGRPPTSKLWKAIQKVEKDKRQPFLEHVAQQAYLDNKLIPPILDRIEPKLASEEERQAAPVVINVVNFVVESPVDA